MSEAQAATQVLDRAIEAAQVDDRARAAVGGVLQQLGISGAFLRDIQALAAEMSSRWEDGPELVVVTSMSDPAVPSEVRAAAASPGAKGAPMGFMQGDALYLVASALTTRKDALSTVAHESVGHWGLRRVLGSRLVPVLDQIVANNKIRVWFKARAYGLDVNNQDHLREAAEEVLAELAESGRELTDVERANAQMRQWLRERAPSCADQPFTDEDLIYAFIEPAKRYLARSRADRGIFRAEPEQEASVQPAAQTQGASGASAVPVAGGSFIADATPTAAALKAWIGTTQVAQDGEPLVVYHATKSDFATFDIDRSSFSNRFGPGFYFTRDQKTLQSYSGDGAADGGGQIMPVYLKLENPLRGPGLTQAQVDAFFGALQVTRFPNGFDATQAHIDLKAHLEADLENAADNLISGAQMCVDPKDWVRGLKAAGFDGHIREVFGEPEYVVLESSQIKSALGNNGDFSPENIDIRFRAADSQPAPASPEVAAATERKERADVRIESPHKGFFNAYVGKKRVGALASWLDSKDDFVVMEVAVSAPFRRRGVATALYRAAEEQAGKQLIPAVSLSDDGFAFWKSYRPAAVANDLRHRPELIGRRAHKDGREGVITKASGGGATLTYPDGMHSYILRRDLDAALLVDAAPGEEGLPQTETKAFKDFFEDSRVVQDGKPLVVYHGTQSSFSSFDPERQGETVFSGDVGFFFTNNPREADAYAQFDWEKEDPQPNVMPVYLAIKNPLMVDITNPAHPGQAPGVWYDTYGAQMAEYAIQSGYDGLIVGDFSEDPLLLPSGINETMYVAFKPEQVKSAIGNNGDFDPGKADIRFKLADARAAQALAPQATDGDRADLFADDFVGIHDVHQVERVISSRGDMAVVLLPNVDSAGRQIASTRQGLENFWTWFAAEGEGLTDDDGRPVLMYHGTNADFAAFESGRLTKNAGMFGEPFETRRAGSFFTPDRTFAEGFATVRGSQGSSVMPVYLRMNQVADFTKGISPALEDALLEGGMTPGQIYNPAIQHDWERFEHEFGGVELVAALKRAGYDGAKIVEDREDGTDGAPAPVYVAFEADQIKSAIGNVGHFSARTADIRFRRGELATPEARSQDLAQPADSWFDGSVVATGDGLPLPVFHGTHHAFDDFKAGVHGIFFTVDPSTAHAYSGVRAGRGGEGANVRPAYLSLKKPWRYIHTSPDQPYSQMVDQSTQTLKAQGYDGIVGSSPGVVIVFDPEQVRSVFDARMDWVPEQSLVASRELVDDLTPGLDGFMKDSKVVDALGRPAVVFHGTADDFSTFEHGKWSRKDQGWLGKGFYFSSSAKTAGSYANLKPGEAAPNVMPVHLAITHPFVATMRHKEVGMLADQRGDKDLPQTRRDELVAQGYDGVMLNYLSDDGQIRETEWVAFEASQIKSAVGNNGQFDRSNQDIRFRRSEGAGIAAVDADAGVSVGGAADVGAAGVPTPPGGAGIPAGLQGFTRRTKVVHPTGEPVRLYHGTVGDFNAFELPSDGGSAAGAQKDTGWYGVGHYLTADVHSASAYAVFEALKSPAGQAESTPLGANVMPLYARLENPYYWPADRVASTSAAESQAITDELRALGHDGVIVANPYADPEVAAFYEVIAFDAAQVKSAIGNNGSYDPANRDIRFKLSDQSGAESVEQPVEDPAEEFDRWYEGSHVSGPDGAPEKVFHGTSFWERADGTSLGDIHEFDRLAVVKNLGRKVGIDTVGSWFSSEPGQTGAGMYAGNVMYPVYLSIKNPWRVTFEGMIRTGNRLLGRDRNAKADVDTANAVREWMKDVGVDGIQLLHDPVSRSTEFEHQTAWVALEPEQIRFAVQVDAILERRRRREQEAERARVAPALAAWLGKSKLVDPSTGMPLVYYRGEQSGSQHTVFDARKTNERGFFFTRSRELAGQYAHGGEPREFYLRAERVLDLTQDTRETRAWVANWAKAWADEGWVDRRSGEDIDPFDLIQAGSMFDYEGDWGAERWRDLQASASMEFDALICPDHHVASEMNEVAASCIVFDPVNIKSATDNNGEFSLDNPDIRFRALGAGKSGPAIEAGLQRSPAHQRSPAARFEDWFDGSVVVDEAGFPKPLFHGTGAVIEDAFRDLSYFTPRADVADLYAQAPTRQVEGGAPNVHAVYVSMKNPYVHDDQAVGDNLSHTVLGRRGRLSEVAEHLKAQGYDGIILRNYNDIAAKGTSCLQDQYVIFDAHQVRPVTGVAECSQDIPGSGAAQLRTWEDLSEAGRQVLRDRLEDPGFRHLLARLEGLVGEVQPPARERCRA